MKPISMRRRRLRLGAALIAVIWTLTACGQIYPSSEPAAGPAHGVKPNVQDVVVGFAQQQLQAPYFAAMQVRAQQIAKEQGFKLLFQSANKDPVVQMNQCSRCCPRVPTYSWSTRPASKARCR